MRSVRPWAYRVTALGVAGVFAAPAAAIAAPLPAAAAPASCARAGTFAAQAGAELIRLNKLEIRPGGGQAGEDGTGATGSDGGALRSKSGRADGSAGMEPGPSGAPNSLSDDGSPGGPGSGSAGSGSAGSGSPGSGSAGSGPAGAGSPGSGSPGSGSPGSGSPGSGSASGSEGRTGILSGSLVDKLTSAGAPGEDAGTVQARKPAGPGSTGAGFSTEPVGADEDGGDLPAPQPTAGSSRNHGTVDHERAGTARGDKARDGGGGSAAAGKPEAAEAGQASAAEADHVGGGADGNATVIRGVLLGEAKTALVATASPTAAAVTRMVNSSETSRLSKPLVQQAPPHHARPERRSTPAAEVGPLLVDAGMLTSHAKSACGTDGETTRAATTLGAAAIAGHHDDALVVVPERVESVSTTALERRGSQLGSVASASIAARTIELLDGAVRIDVVRAPALTTSMSARDGGEVRYAPAVLEVSGDGIKKSTLKTAGDSVEMTFGERAEAGPSPITTGTRGTTGTTGTPAGLPIGPPLTLPGIPGLPSPGAGKPESAPAEGPGTTVRVSLGKVRQAVRGNAIAARASAVEIGISQRAYGVGKAGVALDMTVGELESAAVAAGPGGGVSGAVAGRGGGLPVTGPGVSWIALGGAGLLVAGATALAFGMRRRRRFRA